MNQDKYLVERLNKFREEYITLKEANKAYETMYNALKNSYLKMMSKAYDYTKTLKTTISSLTDVLQEERLQFHSEQKYANDLITDLRSENDEHHSRNESLKKSIKEKDMKISELEKEIEMFKMQINQQEEKYKELDMIYNGLLKLQNDPEGNKDEMNNTKQLLEKNEYLERLKMLESMHKEEGKKQEQEIQRLKSLLKQQKINCRKRTKVTEKRDGNSIELRYPDLSEYVKKSAGSTQVTKKRKLYVTNDGLVDII